MTRQALFAGLVYDQDGNLAGTTHIGDEPFYIVDDNGFQRHIEADTVDRQVLRIFIEQLQNNKDLAVEQALRMIGSDDLFTKAALDSTLSNLDMDQIIEQGIPEQARNMMGMMGFRIIINHHGELVDFHQPTLPDEE